LDHAASGSVSFVLVLRARNRNRERLRRFGAKTELVQFQATAFNGKASKRRQSLPGRHLGLGEHCFRPTASTLTLQGERARIPESFGLNDNGGARVRASTITITITSTKNEHDNEEKYAENRMSHI
jgi:hypothetical protein